MFRRREAKQVEHGARGKMQSQTTPVFAWVASDEEIHTLTYMYLLFVGDMMPRDQVPLQRGYTHNMFGEPEHNQKQSPSELPRNVHGVQGSLTPEEYDNL